MPRQVGAKSGLADSELRKVASAAVLSPRAYCCKPVRYAAAGSAAGAPYGSTGCALAGVLARRSGAGGGRLAAFSGGFLGAGFRVSSFLGSGLASSGLAGSGLAGSDLIAAAGDGSAGAATWLPDPALGGAATGSLAAVS